jgi:tetratricopeptide (TPR) repeat protein
MRTKNRKSRWLAKAAYGIALAAVMSGSRAAFGQYRLQNQDGRLLDASTRLGSGGYNTNAINTTPINTQYIYLGDVTGYGAFQGNVPDRDPRGFQGFIPNQPSLNLQRQAGVSSPTAAPTYGAAQPFYTQYTANSAPISVQQVPGTSSYFAAPPPYQAAQDYRLGSTLNVPQSTLPKLGETVGPGAVDPRASMTPSFLNNAPLDGYNVLNQGNSVGANYALPGTTGLGLANASALSGISQADLVRLRNELSQNTLSTSATAQLQAAGISNQVSGTLGANSTNSGLLLPGSPISGQLPAGPIQSSISPTAGQAQISNSVSPGVNDFSTGQQTRSSIPLPPPPAEQSPQYAKLRELLQQYQASHPKTDEEANRQFQAALKARREYEQSLAHPQAAAKSSDTAAKPTLGNTEQAPSNTTPPPPSLPVGPIGADIRASGLSQMIQQAEDMSRKGRYKDAISKLMDARQVAPNNPLIVVDLAHAQLGAGFYAEAEASLRDAFTTDPSLQLGKYDLKSEIGDERLQVIIADLKQLAVNGDSGTPVLLLAYLSYNMGDTEKAVTYLHLAQLRAGGHDELIRSLGEHWTLPATQPAK